VLRKKALKKSCTGAKLLKEHTMKKTSITTLVILIIASVSIFAAPVTDTDNFTVTTIIAETGKVKVSSAPINGNDLAAYTASGDLASYAITGSGNQTNFTAYLTTLSNNRAGYTVSMSATAMMSADTPTTYIDYTVGCNNKSIVTNGATATSAVEVMNATGLETLSGDSKQISLSIDATTYNKAVSGSYSGTVTFNFSGK